MKISGNWITRANERGEDLTEYKQKMGKAVSESILANPEECERRSKLMGQINKTPLMIEKCRQAAIETSSRQDILIARTEQNAYTQCVKVQNQK